MVIVDDDPAVCSSLKFSLELEGFVVRAYGNAAEFLNADDWACDCSIGFAKRAGGADERRDLKSISRARHKKRCARVCWR